MVPGRYLLLMSYMIPISLKVTLDVSKIYYKLLVGWDMDMYDEETGSLATAQSTSILEDLGQVSFVRIPVGGICLRHQGVCHSVRSPVPIRSAHRCRCEFVLELAVEWAHLIRPTE